MGICLVADVNPIGNSLLLLLDKIQVDWVSDLLDQLDVWVWMDYGTCAITHNTVTLYGTDV